MKIAHISLLVFTSAALALTPACKKKDKKQDKKPAGDKIVNKGDQTAKAPAPTSDKDLLANCEKVTEHIFAIESKEMAPATFANPDQRKEMMRSNCKKFGLAPGEMACILKASGPAELNKCRPKNRPTTPAPGATPGSGAKLPAAPTGTAAPGAPGAKPAAPPPAPK